MNETNRKATGHNPDLQENPTKRNFDRPNVQACVYGPPPPHDVFDVPITKKSNKRLVIAGVVIASIIVMLLIWMI